MRILSNAELLSLWERGHRLHSLDQGLLAVRAALAGPGNDNVADWTLGRRNQAVAQLHGSHFGDRLQGWTECGLCKEKLEFAIDCGDLIERQCEASAKPILVKGRLFRSPTSRDLARIAVEPDTEAAALRLAACCCLDAGADDSAAALEWSREELEELSEKMIEADPLAEIMLSFECPVCRCAREQVLDLTEFFWAELEAAANRILREVHILASAYGWSEGEILALSDGRRAMYLQMVQA